MNAINSVQLPNLINYCEEQTQILDPHTQLTLNIAPSSN